ncbi:TlpA family protein disulfide reductase [Turneriella parva]|uniref:Alkyl hydroperoxide reductase/ Thiol specific antioxidant/ Mal allergen n=1 Tax=Turneriella parva (strain ATCC BAA-1111 / DSM 21527 / NCTC 11395 / H) TaxID=869212 RepID=I4B7V0_TURPD|nr:TlpA disulfide reductase family protein [Turneriella parva]AFM13357.1 alkyl hydroperoxide reductase/ Thiol specific antioxidant/ Mal allergen [Turneriella parva DSM 21527]
MRSFFAALVLCSLLSACKAKETFVDEQQAFKALAGDGSFSLASVAPEVQTVVFNFYAPDCPPCEKEVPALKAFAQKYAAARNLRFVAVGSSLRAVAQDKEPAQGAVTLNEIVSELNAFSRKFNLGYPQYIAEAAQLKSWRVTGFPETFVFQRVAGRWQLDRKYISEITFDQLEQVTGGIRH